MTNRYGALAARVYHLDKPVGHSFGDIEYYIARLAGVSGPILEPGVGNGRILIPLCEAGHDVWGFDTSEDMLAYCKAECAARGIAADISRQGFADFAYDERFAAIVVPTGSFQLITDFEAARAVLLRFFDHLQPGGRLMFDLMPLDGLAPGSAGTRSWQTPEGELLTLDTVPISSDAITQVTVQHLRYHLWRDGALAQSELDVFSLRWWGMREMEMLLTSVGFTEIEFSGDYSRGRPPANGNGIVCVEAVRPG